MDATLNGNPRLGRFIASSTAGERFKAFLPPPLPPRPPLDLTSQLVLLEGAGRALGRLDGVATILPDTSLLLYLYVRKEAVLSSQIEGTQSSIADLLLFENDEAPGVPIDDVEEVSNYVAAMYHGLARLREGFPLSLRLIRELHAILLRGRRGADKQPGEFRRSQNWIGGPRPSMALFVPPPPDQLPGCLHQFETYLHDDSDGLPLLVRAAIAHVQFESIHPFLDGNGRLGRLLITFMLCAAGALREPLLYLSLYFKSYRSTYYDLLQRVRETGDWEAWTRFFLTGVKETADQAADTAHDILELFARDRARIEALGRAAGSALRVHQQLQKRPLLSVTGAAAALNLSPPTVSSSIRHLLRLGIVREITGRQRGQFFQYERYMALLNRGTEPRPSDAEGVSGRDAVATVF